MSVLLDLVIFTLWFFSFLDSLKDVEVIKEDLKPSYDNDNTTTSKDKKTSLKPVISNDNRKRHKLINGKEVTFRGVTSFEYDVIMK